MTALRRELKSANKERKKEIQKEIQRIEEEGEATVEQVTQEHNEEQQVKDAEEAERRLAILAKKKEKEAARSAELERIRQDAIENLAGKPDDRELERVKLEERLEQDDLMIHEVPADGSCLFASIAHQLLVVLGLDVKAEQVRLRVSEYLALHADHYAPFIDYTEYGSYGDYCHAVTQKGFWGGDVELDAACRVYQVLIKVYKADGVIEFKPDTEYDHTLRVSFHQSLYTLGAHYNSLIKRA